MRDMRAVPTSCVLALLVMGCTDLGGQVPDAAPEPDSEATSFDGGVVVDVAMLGSQFVPKELEIGAGTTVRWTNYELGILHSATQGMPNGATQPAWDSGLFAVSESWQLTFTEIGVVPYYCKIHSGMKGTVTVR